MLTTLHSINSDFTFPLAGTCSVVTASGLELEPIINSTGKSIYGRFLNAMEPIFIHNALESITLLPCYQHLPDTISNGWLHSPRTVFGSLTQNFYFYGSSTLTTAQVIDVDLTSGVASSSSASFVVYPYSENFGYISLSMVPDHAYQITTQDSTLEVLCQAVSSNYTFNFLNKYGVPDIFTGVDKITPTHSIEYQHFDVSRLERSSIIRSYNPQESSTTACKTFVLDNLNQRFLSELVCSPEVSYKHHVVPIDSSISISSKSDAFTFTINTAL